MMHGRSGAMRVLGLPGNPVSSYVCAFLFMVPLIRALSGRNDLHHPFEAAELAADLPANDQRQDYLRAQLSQRPDALPLATAVTRQDSSLQAYLASAQALIVRTPFAPAAPAGSVCRILKLPL
jgi:molybdopterin molybdotransferase